MSKIEKKKHFKDMTRTEKVEKLQPREKKYRKADGKVDKQQLVEDFENRYFMAIEEGQDPLGSLTIDELFREWQHMKKYYDR